jgi:hypothetical protein
MLLALSAELFVYPPTTAQHTSKLTGSAGGRYRNGYTEEEKEA